MACCPGVVEVLDRMDVAGLIVEGRCKKGSGFQIPGVRAFCVTGAELIVSGFAQSVSRPGTT